VIRAAAADDTKNMADAITDLVDGAMGSPWVYLALLAFAALDAFFPLVPSESLVISAGVYAASGEPNLAGVIVVAALGAFAGDHVSYMIGRTAGRRVVAGTKAGTRRAAAIERGGKLLADRGGTFLIVCRYIPGARTAITLSAGALRYRLRSFSFFDGIAASSWATYSALVGYVGGSAFEDDPLKGLGLGLGIALTVTLLVEVIRHLRRRPAYAR
jgi:membrane protein DedA with SNARE-associated domain